MKPIKFEELNWQKSKTTVLFYLLVLVFILPSMFDAWDFLGAKTVKYLNLFFTLGMLIKGIRPFFYNHYVQWNKAGITIRVNSFFGINVSFSEVQNITYAEDQYTIYTFSGKSPKVVNLEGVEQESKERLLGVLRQYVR